MYGRNVHFERPQTLVVVSHYHFIVHAVFRALLIGVGTVLLARYEYLKRDICVVNQRSKHCY